MIIDFDKIGAQEVINELESGNYGNDCISPHVKQIESVEIGEWEDSNPLNFKSTQDEAFNKLFDKRSQAGDCGPEGSQHAEG